MDRGKIQSCHILLKHRAVCIFYAYISHPERQLNYIYCRSTFHRPFHAHGIPNSNLLLVVINKIESVADSYWFEGAMKTEAQVMETYSQYGVEFPCHKLYMNDLHRRRLTECFVSATSIRRCRRWEWENVLFMFLILSTHPWRHFTFTQFFFSLSYPDRASRRGGDCILRICRSDSTDNCAHAPATVRLSC